MWKWLIAGVGLVTVFAIYGPHWGTLRRAATWQQLTSPGPLSRAHAFIGNNCGACHTPVAGVTRAKCVTCHANETDLLDLQPTAFHAGISECAPCHYEHVAGIQRPIQMDHAALAKIGLAELGKGGPGAQQTRARLVAWMRSAPASNRGGRLSAEERLLNCISCHQVKDVHSGNFGQNCALCHGTRSWFIEAYVHPPPSTHGNACNAIDPRHAISWGAAWR